MKPGPLYWQHSVSECRLHGSHGGISAEVLYSTVLSAVEYSTVQCSGDMAVNQGASAPCMAAMHASMEGSAQISSSDIPKQLMKLLPPSPRITPP